MGSKLLFITIAVLILKFISGKAVKKYQSGFKAKFFGELKEWADSGIWAVIIALFIMTFFLQAFRIPSSSMEDTLLIGDHLLVKKFTFGYRNPFDWDKRYLQFRIPKRGDIVIFNYPKDTSFDYIKRLIGEPGDEIEIVDKQVFINGEPLEEEYTKFTDPTIYSNAIYHPYQYRNRDNFGPIIVPEGEYFMMGDNRDASSDSRDWGPLPEKYIKGEALLKHWPPSRMGLIK
ncbi:MAG: signal peptidase I [Elusimicrobia bacterium]|nr:signal peptidase I [Elusimicrobiota bacterium]